MRVRISRGAVILLMFTAVMGIAESLRGGSYGALWERIFPWLVVMVAAGLHELGHALAAWGMGVRLGGMKLDLFGARMELCGMPSYGQELLIAAGGPGMNLLAAALVYPYYTARGAAGLSLFLGASVVLAGVNLLPVETLDGGRMLRSGLAWLAGDRIADGVLRGTTGVFLGILWLLAVYALLRNGQMLSLFVFSLCLLMRVVRAPS